MHYWRVRELFYASGIVFALLVLSALVMLDPLLVMAWSQQFMVVAAMIAVPFEVAYFVGLRLALAREGAPPGWYWRSFDHHHKLGPRERWIVLSFFAIGTLCMVLASLGVVVVFAALLTSFR